MCMYVCFCVSIHVTSNVELRNYVISRQNFIKLGVRSLANASRARQFNPLNPPGVGWVPLPQTNMAAVVGRARSCAVVRGRSCAVVRGRARSCAVVRGRAWSCAVGRAWSGAVGRARSCVVVRSCRSARFAASTAVTRTNEGRNERTNNI